MVYAYIQRTIAKEKSESNSQPTRVEIVAEFYSKNDSQRKI